MNDVIAARLAELGLALPDVSGPARAFEPVLEVGDLLFVSGQTPKIANRLMVRGRVGVDLSVDEGIEAARLAVLNLLANVEAAVGLERLRRIVKVNGYVACADDFGEQPRVIDGASELLVALFGDAGRHARCSVGVGALPGGAPVEVEMVVQLDRPGPLADGRPVAAS